MADQSTIEIIIQMRNGQVFQNLENNARKAFNSIDTRLAQTTSMFNGLLGTLGMVGGAMGLGLLAKGVIKLGADLEQTKISFEVLTGNAEVAGKLLTKLNEYANLTPYTNSNIMDSAKMMLAYGVETKDVMNNIRMLGDIAQGNGPKLDRITLAFSQIMTTGRLMGQDLLQLTTNGFNPLRVIADKTGRSMLDLRKDMEKGNISAKMVIEAFKIATSEGGKFYDMANKQSQTLAGLWSTLVGNLQYVTAQIMNANSGPLKDMVASFVNITNTIMAHQDVVAKYIKIILKSIALFVTWKVSMMAIYTSMKIGTLAMKAYTFATLAMNTGLRQAIILTKTFNASMKANIIGLVLTGLAYLITKLWDLNSAMEENTTQQAKWADQIQRTRDLADEIKGVAVEYENLSLLTKTQKVQLADNLGEQKVQLQQKLTDVRVKLASDKTYQDYLTNRDRLIELGKKANKTNQDINELNVLLDKTKQFRKPGGVYGADAYLIERYGVTEKQLLDTMAGVDKRIKGMKKLGFTPSVDVGLTPSTDLNNLTTELSTKRNIKNITLNIQQLIGVETLTTTNMTQSSEDIGKLILAELNKTTINYVGQVQN